MISTSDSSCSGAPWPLRFWLAHIAGAKGHLPLQVGEIHHIEIHQPILPMPAAVK